MPGRTAEPALGAGIVGTTRPIAAQLGQKPGDMLSAFTRASDDAGVPSGAARAPALGHNRVEGKGRAGPWRIKRWLLAPTGNSSLKHHVRASCPDGRAASSSVSLAGARETKREEARAAAVHKGAFPLAVRHTRQGLAKSSSARLRDAADYGRHKLFGSNFMSDGGPVKPFSRQSPQRRLRPSRRSIQGVSLRPLSRAPIAGAIYSEEKSKSASPRSHRP